MKTLVLGLGNDILSDDGVGIYVARELKKIIHSQDITVAEASLAGIGLLDMLAGHDKAIIIDAIQTKDGKPGQIYRLDSASLAATRHTASTHNVNFAAALEIGRQAGIALPEQITIFGIEAVDVSTFSEDCTPDVKKSIPGCLEMVLQEIDEKP
jgi:hydrogenase maturation protease